MRRHLSGLKNKMVDRNGGVNMQYEWYKEEETDTIWWLDNGDEVVGEFVFSFDKKKRFNLFRDYPFKLTKEQKEIFDKENPDWADFFKDRNQSDE